MGLHGLDQGQLYLLLGVVGFDRIWDNKQYYSTIKSEKFMRIK
jgi:hypothetical protein